MGVNLVDTCTMIPSFDFCFPIHFGGKVHDKSNIGIAIANYPAWEVGQMAFNMGLSKDTKRTKDTTSAKDEI